MPGVLRTRRRTHGGSGRDAPGRLGADAGTGRIGRRRLLAHARGPLQRLGSGPIALPPDARQHRGMDRVLLEADGKAGPRSRRQAIGDVPTAGPGHAPDEARNPRRVRLRGVPANHVRGRRSGFDAGDAAAEFHRSAEAIAEQVVQSSADAIGLLPGRPDHDQPQRRPREAGLVGSGEDPPRDLPGAGDRDGIGPGEDRHAVGLEFGHRLQREARRRPKEPVADPSTQPTHRFGEAARRPRRCRGAVQLELHGRVAGRIMAVEAEQAAGHARPRHRPEAGREPGRGPHRQVAGHEQFQFRRTTRLPAGPRGRLGPRRTGRREDLRRSTGRDGHRRLLGGVASGGGDPGGLARHARRKQRIGGKQWVGGVRQGYIDGSIPRGLARRERQRLVEGRRRGVLDPPAGQEDRGQRVVRVDGAVHPGTSIGTRTSTTLWVSPWAPVTRWSLKVSFSQRPSTTRR